MLRKHLAIGIIFLFSFFCSIAQSDVPHGWHLLDSAKDSFYGISLDKAYQFLKEKNKKSKPVIVAVLDGGIDTSHEDLKNILWRNPTEIAGNGKDDDKNGYVDDKKFFAQANFSIDRTLWGVNYGIGMVSNDVQVAVFLFANK